MSVVLVMHDLGVMARVADRVAVMYTGRIFEQGPVRDVLRHPASSNKRGLLASVVRAKGPRRPASPAPPGLRRPPPGFDS